MTANQPIELECAAPSIHERVRALSEQKNMFDLTSKHPQAGIYKRFGKEWTMVRAYVEGEVRECSDAAKKFVREQSRGIADETQLRDELSVVMKKLQDCLLLDSEVVEASQKMALANSPSKRSMDNYRAFSRSSEGKLRAANGDLLSSYGLEGESVPYELATICNEDFEPVAEFIADRLMNPFLELISTPFRSILLKLPFVGKRFPNQDPDDRWVDANTISALAKAFMVMIAILCLTAAIFTLDVVKDPKVRILVVALFAQAFALPIQFLGSRSLPLYTLICAYFQAMVVFVGTTSE